MSSRALVRLRVNSPAGARAYVARATWAVVDQGINPLIQLSITPYLLHALGNADFAIWALGNTLIAVSQLVSLGAGIAAVKHVSAGLGAGVRSRAVDAVRAALTIALVGGAAAALLAWGLARFVVDAFFVHMGDPKRVAAIVAWSGLAAAVQELDNVFAGALRGAERFDLGAKIEVPSRLIIGATLLIAASRFPDVENLFETLIAMMSIKAVVKGFSVARLLQSHSSLLPTNRLDSLRPVFAFGIWQWLQIGGTVLFTASDQLLIGGLLGAAALTRYSVCLQLAQYVHLLPSVMMQVIFPRISAMGANLAPRHGNKILARSTLAAIAIAAGIGVPLVVMARPALGYWIDPAFADANAGLLRVLVLVHISLAANIGGYFVLLGSGRSKRSALIVLAAGLTQSAFAAVIAPLGLMAMACNRFLYASITAWLYRAARFKTE